MGHGAAVAMIDPDAPPGTASEPSQSLRFLLYSLLYRNAFGPGLWVQMT
jgi:hypothetical protein